MFPGRPACACCGNPFCFREEFGEWICAACDLMLHGEPFLCSDWLEGAPLVPAGLSAGGAA
jgi:ribosomal protein L37AE/L43A